MPTHAADHAVSRTAQPPRQRGADQAAGAGHQHPGARALRRALWSGGLASAISTCALTWLSRRRTGAASAATNATSHWLWGRRAQRRDGANLRHTAVGYVIHHASSVFWAVVCETAAGEDASFGDRAAAAAGTAALAYAVDYGVVPRRLTPGFEARLPHRDLSWVYAAFALGLLCAPAIAARRPRRAAHR